MLLQASVSFLDAVSFELWGLHMSHVKLLDRAGTSGGLCVPPTHT